MAIVDLMPILTMQLIACKVVAEFLQEIDESLTPLSRAFLNGDDL